MKRVKIKDSKSSVLNCPLYGLVLAGGESRRMNSDKAAISYRGVTQAGYCYGLLSAFCSKVFISNRKKQSLNPGHEGLPQIHDSCIGSGPIVGIVSAMKAHPTVAWLVLACDMPFVDAGLISTLIRCRDPRKQATAFVASDGQLEPLCAIYEPSSLWIFSSCIRQGAFSPRHALTHAEVRSVWPEDPNLLANINTAAERRRVFQAMGSS